MNIHMYFDQCFAATQVDLALLAIYLQPPTSTEARIIIHCGFLRVYCHDTFNHLCFPHVTDFQALYDYRITIHSIDCLALIQCNSSTDIDACWKL